MGKYESICCCVVLCVLAICVTVYQLNSDPRDDAMKICSSGYSTTVEQKIECAKAIYGEPK